MRGIYKIVPTSLRTSFEQLPEIHKTSVFHFIFFRVVSAFFFCFSFCFPRSSTSLHLIQEKLEMMDSVYPEPLSRLHRRAVRKKFHKDSARYRTQPVTFAEIKEVDEEQVCEESQNTGNASKSELDLKAKFEEFKRQRDKDLLEIRLTTNGLENESRAEARSVVGSPPPILPYRGCSSCPRTSV